MTTDRQGDEAFPRRVITTSAVVAAVFLVYFLQLSIPVALGFLFGWALGLLGFLAWKIAIDRLVREGPEALARKGKSWLLLLTVLKLPLMGAILAVAILVLHVDLFALAGGVTLLPAIVVLKIVGKACFGDARRRIGPSLV